MSDDELAEWLKAHISELVDAVKWANQSTAPPYFWADLEQQLRGIKIKLIEVRK